jgi:hypothetical protein
MASAQPELRRQFSRYNLTLSVLMLLASTADARTKASPSQQYPGPWLEVSQAIRDVLTLNNVLACTQAAGRQSSQNPGEFLLYCTRDEKVWTSWRVEPAAHRLRGPGKLLEGIPLPDSY